jgi:hypothetical protein
MGISVGAYFFTRTPTFEKELEYYREWTKVNPSGSSSREWEFRNIRENPVIAGNSTHVWKVYFENGTFKDHAYLYS